MNFRYSVAIIDNFSATLTRLQNGINNITNSANKLTPALRSASRSLHTFSLISNAALGTSIYSAAEFEQSMARLATVTSTSTQSMSTSLDNARKNALSFSQQWTASANEIIQAQFELATAGVPVEEQIAAVNGAFKLAKATVGDFTETTQFLGSLLNTFGTTARYAFLEPMEKVRVLTDALSVSIQKFQATIPVLIEGFKFIVGPATQLGLKFEEVTVALGILNTAGFRGTIAGTAMGNMFNKLQRAIDKLDLNPQEFTDLQGNLTSTTDFLDAMYRAMENYSPLERLNKLIEIFDIRAGRVISTLIVKRKALRDLTTEIEASTGATEKLALMVETTARAQFIKLINTIKNVGIAIGDNLFVVVKPVLNSLLIIGRGLSNLAQTFGPTISALAAFIGLWLGFRSILAISQKAMGSFLGEFIKGDIIFRNIALAVKSVTNVFSTLIASFGKGGGIRKIFQDMVSGFSLTPARNQAGMFINPKNASYTYGFFRTLKQTLTGTISPLTAVQRGFSAITNVFSTATGNLGKFSVSVRSYFSSMISGLASFFSKSKQLSVFAKYSNQYPAIHGKYDQVNIGSRQVSTVSAYKTNIAHLRNEVIAQKGYLSVSDRIITSLQATKIALMGNVQVYKNVITQVKMLNSSTSVLNGRLLAARTGLVAVTTALGMFKVAAFAAGVAVKFLEIAIGVIIFSIGYKLAEWIMASTSGIWEWASSLLTSAANATTFEKVLAKVNGSFIEQTGYVNLLASEYERFAKVSKLGKFVTDIDKPMSMVAKMGDEIQNMRRASDSGLVVSDTINEAYFATLYDQYEEIAEAININRDSLLGLRYEYIRYFDSVNSGFKNLTTIEKDANFLKSVATGINEAFLLLGGQNEEVAKAIAKSIFAFDRFGLSAEQVERRVLGSMSNITQAVKPTNIFSGKQEFQNLDYFLTFKRVAEKEAEIGKRDLVETFASIPDLFKDYVIEVKPELKILLPKFRLFESARASGEDIHKFINKNNDLFKGFVEAASYLKVSTSQIAESLTIPYQAISENAQVSFEEVRHSLNLIEKAFESFDDSIIDFPELEKRVLKQFEKLQEKDKIFPSLIDGIKNFIEVAKGLEGTPLVGKYVGEWVKFAKEQLGFVTDAAEKTKKSLIETLPRIDLSKYFVSAVPQWDSLLKDQRANVKSLAGEFKSIISDAISKPDLKVDIYKQFFNKLQMIVVEQVADYIGLKLAGPFAKLPDDIMRAMVYLENKLGAANFQELILDPNRMAGLIDEITRITTGKKFQVDIDTSKIKESLAEIEVSMIGVDAGTYAALNRVYEITSKIAQRPLIQWNKDELLDNINYVKEMIVQLKRTEISGAGLTGLEKVAQQMIEELNRRSGIIDRQTGVADIERATAIMNEKNFVEKIRAIELDKANILGFATNIEGMRGVTTDLRTVFDRFTNDFKFNISSLDSITEKFRNIGTNTASGNKVDLSVHGGSTQLTVLVEGGQSSGSLGEYLTDQEIKEVVEKAKRELIKDFEQRIRTLELTLRKR